jgi:fumarate reductase subunit D
MCLPVLGMWGALHREVCLAHGQHLEECDWCVMACVYLFLAHVVSFYSLEGVSAWA